MSDNPFSAEHYQKQADIERQEKQKEKLRKAEKKKREIEEIRERFCRKDVAAVYIKAIFDNNIKGYKFFIKSCYKCIDGDSDKIVGDVFVKGIFYANRDSDPRSHSWVRELVDVEVYHRVNDYFDSTEEYLKEIEKHTGYSTKDALESVGIKRAQQIDKAQIEQELIEARELIEAQQTEMVRIEEEAKKARQEEIEMEKDKSRCALGVLIIIFLFVCYLVFLSS